MPCNKANIRNELRQTHGIDFSADFHTLNTDQCIALHDMAKEVGYRQPKNANGSLGRYFFAYLNREPKTELMHIVQGHYGYGWEDLTGSLNRAEAKANLKDYRENAPGSYRLIQRREKING